MHECCLCMTGGLCNGTSRASLDGLRSTSPTPPPFRRPWFITVTMHIRSVSQARSELSSSSEAGDRGRATLIPTQDTGDQCRRWGTTLVKSLPSITTGTLSPAEQLTRSPGHDPSVSSVVSWCCASVYAECGTVIQTALVTLNFFST